MLLPVTLAAGALAVGTLLTPAANADTSTPETTCHATYDVDITPGLSTKPAAATTFADNVPVTCDGPLMGATVHGPGRMTSLAHLDERSSCLGGGGWGDIQLRFPRSGGGHLVVPNPITYTFGGLEHGGITGQFTGDHLDGTFTVLPLRGDCLTQPLTRARLTLAAHLHPFHALSGT